MQYAQLYAYGQMSDAKITGQPQDQIDTVKGELLDAYAASVPEQLYLSDQSKEAYANYILEDIKTNSNIQTTLKKDDSKSPVVEVKASLNDIQSIQEALLQDPAFHGLLRIDGFLWHFA